MSELPTECCAHCRFWDAKPVERDYSHHFWTLACRRRAPVVVVRANTPLEGETDVDTEFPTTRGDAWCGEWEAAR